MVTNTLIDAEGDLGDTVATYVFDVRLARSLLRFSGLLLAGALTGLTVAIGSEGGGIVMALLVPTSLVGVALIAAWGVLLAITRLQRRTDLFVVSRYGLAHHHDGQATTIRWVDIVSVTHSGSQAGSKVARWIGIDYTCRIALRSGGGSTFDNYVTNAVSLGQEVERRSLL